VTRVLEYAAPTHPPEFLFPDLSKAELDSHVRWLAPDHYSAVTNRLILTIQLWVVHAGGKVIIVDTGVGDMKSRGPARMNMLNGLLMFWLEAAGAAPDTVTPVVHCARAPSQQAHGQEAGHPAIPDRYSRWHLLRD
jgi:hypothetical protein